MSEGNKYQSAINHNVVNPVSEMKNDLDFKKTISGQRSLPTYSSQQTLLSLQLMMESMGGDTKDDDVALIQKYANRELLYVKNAMRMLAGNPVLARQMGGMSFETALTLADILQQKAIDKELDSLVGDQVDVILKETGSDAAHIKAQKAFKA